jgi:thiol-disulfide isomerase/thioredoxin
LVWPVYAKNFKRFKVTNAGSAWSAKQVRQALVRFLYRLKLLRFQFLLIKPKIMKQIILCSLMLLFNYSLFAQVNTPAMKVGDVLPAGFWSAAHLSFERGTVIKKTFSELKGKIIVLDFWATWCGPCIADMPSQAEVLKNYHEEIEVVRVSKEKAGLVQNFFNSKRNVLGNGLTSIIADSTLNKSFPHKFIPHLVWIGRDGKILGFTTAASFTKTNIDNIISGRNELVSYYDLNGNAPLFMEQLPGQAVAINIMVKGKIEGLGAGFEKRDGGKSAGLLVKNATLRNIYSMIARRTFSWYAPARMVLSFEDKGDFENVKYAPAELWNIDFWQPRADSSHLYQNLLNFISANCGYSAAVELREQQCLVLKYNKRDPSKLIAKGGVGANTVFRENGQITNGKIEWLRMRLEEQPWVAMPVMDETGIDFQIDLKAPVCASVTMLNSYLDGYGLNAVIENRSIPMVVVRKNQVLNAKQ